MSDSVQPHRWQPTRLPRPWDSPGKNTGVGCHFLLQCVKVKSESEIAESCLTLSYPMDCSLPGSSVHGIFQARVPEWGAVATATVLDVPNRMPAWSNSLCRLVLVYRLQPSCSVLTGGEQVWSSHHLLRALIPSREFHPPNLI